MVDGKDWAFQLGNVEFDDLGGGKNVGMLVWMLKPKLHTGCYIMIDSGFNIVNAIIDLKKKIASLASLIKTYCFWLLLAPKVHMMEYFNYKLFGSTDTIFGIVDGVQCNMGCMKESKYVITIMAMFRALSSEGGMKICQIVTKFGKEKIYKCLNTSSIKPLVYHFWYHHAIYHNYNLWYAVSNIEGTWTTEH